MARSGQAAVQSLARCAHTVLGASWRHGVPEYEGHTVGDFMERWGLTAEEAANRLLDEEGEALFVVTFTIDEADVRRVMAYPVTMIGSDGVPAVGGSRIPGCGIASRACSVTMCATSTCSTCQPRSTR
jgi:hypothetical protein